MVCFDGNRIKLKRKKEVHICSHTRIVIINASGLQEDALSSTIFNIMLSCAIDESEGKRTGHILNRTTQIFEYADDIAIVNKNIYDFSKTN